MSDINKHALFKATLTSLGLFGVGALIILFFWAIEKFLPAWGGGTLIGVAVFVALTASFYGVNAQRSKKF